MTLTKARTQTVSGTAALLSFDYLNLVTVGLALYNSASSLNEFANPAFASLHGYMPMELRNTPSQSLIAEGDRAEWTESLEDALSTGNPFSLEIDRVRKDGTNFPSFIRVTPDSADLGGHYFLEVHDREEQRNITSAMNQDRSLLLASLQQLPIPVLVLSPELTDVLVQSDAFHQMFSNSKDLTNSALNRAHRAIAGCLHHSPQAVNGSSYAVSANDTGMIVDIQVQAKQVFDYAGAVMAIAVVIKPFDPSSPLTASSL